MGPPTVQICGRWLPSRLVSGDDICLIGLGISIVEKLHFFAVNIVIGNSYRVFLLVSLTELR